MSCNTMIQWHCVAMASCQTKDNHNPDGLQQFGAQVTFICCSLMQSHNTFDSFGSLPMFQTVLRTASVHVAYNLQTYTLCVRNELTCSLNCLSFALFLQVTAFLHEQPTSQAWLSQMSKQLAAGEPAVQSALHHYLQCADSPDRYIRCSFT